MSLFRKLFYGEGDDKRTIRIKPLSHKPNASIAVDRSFTAIGRKVKVTNLSSVAIGRNIEITNLDSVVFRKK